MGTEAIELPSLPSKLIRLAIKDLKAVEKMKTRRVYMGQWHLPDYNNKGKRICSVCLAGAVMDRTLKLNPGLNATPEIFELQTRVKLEALDYFRRGDTHVAFNLLGLNFSDGLLFMRPIQNYAQAKVRFKKAMLKLADDLEKAGY